MSTTKPKKEKEFVEHRDLLGSQVQVGSIVAGSIYNRTVGIFKVVKLNPKMISVSKLSKKGFSDHTSLLYASDVIVLNSQVEDAAMLYILRNA